MKYSSIGLMSGTSLDGTDIAYCLFENSASGWNFRIIKAQTIPYPPVWEKRLRSAPEMNGEELIKTHVDYGHYLGKITKEFIITNNYKDPDLVASHGHTVFHQPENGFTFQMGDGSAIAAQSGCRVVCDFRSLNIACGGQGAPLVPIGDELLFGNFDFCLNLGGFANISFKKQNKRIAFDVCPVNFVINNIVRKRKKEASKILFDDKQKKIDYDPNGKIARPGKNFTRLTDELNKLDYYQKKPPKSLGAEWVEKNIPPIIKKYHDIPLQDILRSFYEHIALRINKTVKNNPGGKMLVTGGGAYNKFLIDLLKNKLPLIVHIPDRNIIEYKEALIFAFLGVLRINNMHNILKSASGGRKNNTGGGIYEGR